MPSKLRLYYELCRLHWFPLGTDTVFWPFGMSVVFSFTFGNQFKSMGFFDVCILLQHAVCTRRIAYAVVWVYLYAHP